MRCAKTLVCLLLVLTLGFCLGGCIPQVALSSEASAGQGEQHIVRDYRGVRVALPAHPSRILTLSSAFDTIVLGMVDSKRLVAVSGLTKLKDYSLSYKEAKQVKRTMHNYGLEDIVALKPDVVIVPDFTSRDVIDGLTGMGIPVVVVKLQSTVKGTEQTITELANIVNEPAKGKAMVDKLDGQLSVLRAKAALLSPEDRQSVLFLSSMDGYAGKDSLFDDMTKYMGMINGPSAAGYPPRTAFTDERVLQMNPDYIFVPMYGHATEAMLDRYRTLPSLAPVKARQLGHVEGIPAAYLYTGNQYIGEVMIQLMVIVYPQLFTEQERKAYTIHAW